VRKYQDILGENDSVDTERIINELGLIPGGSFRVVDIQIVQWGRDLIFTFHYQTVQPDGTPDVPAVFNLVFRDCRDLHWKSYAHIALLETGQVAVQTEVAEIALGQSNHRRDANLLTSHFAATVSYGHIELEYNGTRYRLD
jgi:hypothetical protein